MEPKTRLKNNQLTEIELVSGKNGVALFNDWSRLREEMENCSRDEITKLYRLRRT